MNADFLKHARQLRQRKSDDIKVASLNTADEHAAFASNIETAGLIERRHVTVIIINGFIRQLGHEYFGLLVIDDLSARLNVDERDAGVHPMRMTHEKF